MADATPGGLAAVEYVYIDSAPHTDAYDADELLPEYANLPDAFLDRLAELLANRDAVSCWQCGAGAGYVLVQRGDHEVIEWAITALAREGSNPVAVLCEACSPYVPTEPDPQPAPSVADVVHALRRIAADMHAKIAADDDGSPWGGGAQTMVELLEAEAVKIGNGGPLVPAGTVIQGGKS